ncbi:MAG TPA: acetate/propionate family kinase [Trebonia sp.]
MSLRVLVVNAGSSSLKLRVLSGDDSVTATADLPALRGDASGEAPLADTVKSFGPVDAVGHRVVHGGTLYSRPVLVTGDVRRRLESLTDLAPLHQPKSLEALDAVSRLLPDVPAVACFDTAFHATIPEAAATFALPSEWRARWTLRRYGFHGLSHSYVSRRAAELYHPGGATPRDPPAHGGLRAPHPPAGGTSPPVPPIPLRIVTCHLGAGASLAAVRDGASVDTTMGFTPLDGLVMATRSGSVDPGLVLWLAEHAGTPPAELAATLEQRSGLAGLAGTPDMREVLSRAVAGDANAILGRDVYLHRLRGLIASMTASMGGLDALVFTGGVGENSAEIRWRAARGLSFLGVGVDSVLNENPDGADDYEISAAGTSVRSFVIAAREDKQIAAEVRSILGTAP